MAEPLLFFLIILHSLRLEYGSAQISPPPPDSRLDEEAPLLLPFFSRQCPLPLPSGWPARWGTSPPTFSPLLYVRGSAE